MILKTDEFINFHYAHNRLLHYCYCIKNNLDDELSFDEFIKMPVEIKYEARNFLNENNSLLKKYLEKNDQITVSEKEILSGFKNKLSDRFVILKQLKNHAIFMHLKTELFYEIVALTEPLGQIFDRLPVLTETTILPFNKKIIYDGFLSGSIYIGKNMEKTFLEQYSNAKKKKMIINKLSE